MAFCIKRFVRGLIMAMCVYTVIPMPKNVWDKDALHLVLPLFPQTGVVVGTLWYLLGLLLHALALPVFSRNLIGIAFLNIRPLSKDGYGAAFQTDAKTRHTVSLVLFAALCVVAGFFTCGVTALIPLCAVAVVVAVTLWSACGQLKGISGDLCGCASTIGELCGVMAAAVLGGNWMVWIVGGAYQGKLAYATERLVVSEDDVYTCGQEPVPDFRARAIRCLERVLVLCTAQRTESAVVITHGGVIAALMEAIFPGEKDSSAWQPECGRRYTVVLTEDKTRRRLL